MFFLVKALALRVAAFLDRLVRLGESPLAFLRESSPSSLAAVNTSRVCKDSQRCCVCLIVLIVFLVELLLWILNGRKNQRIKGLLQTSKKSHPRSTKDKIYASLLCFIRLWYIY